MPKIIENLESKLMMEARKQIETIGYAAMTVRSVAAACGVGVGTVYNYYSSKDELTAAYMLEDWDSCIAAVQAAGTGTSGPEPVLRCAYEQLRVYVQRHQAVLMDDTAAASFGGSFSRYHKILRSQLAKPLEKFCPDMFWREFIAEAMLTWTLAGKDFDEIYGVIRKLF